MEGAEAEKREVVVYFSSCKVEGWLYLPHKAELSDFVTFSPRKFITIFNVTISSIRDHESWRYEVEKVSISKDHIANIFSRKDMKPAVRIPQVAK